MDITRKDIENEPNYKKLQAIGRAFRKEGHKLVLNAPEDDLKARLLNIFDNHYAVSEDVVEEKEEAISEVIDEPDSKSEVVEVADVGTDAIESHKEQLYIAPRFYRDWASGWTFTPGMDEPKALPDTLTPGLENALKNKKIIPFEG